MNSAKNTVLISHGSERIVFAIASRLSEGGSRDVMTGRNAERLDEAATKPDKITTILADVTKEEDVIRLTEQINIKVPALNVSINNSGKAFVNRISAHAGAFQRASTEILTNDLSVVGLTNPASPTAKTNESGYRQHIFDNRFRPLNNLSAHAVSKAALHSYTQALRMRRAKSTSIKAFALSADHPTRIAQDPKDMLALPFRDFFSSKNIQVNLRTYGYVFRAMATDVPLSTTSDELGESVAARIEERRESRSSPGTIYRQMSIYGHAATTFISTNRLLTGLQNSIPQERQLLLAARRRSQKACNENLEGAYLCREFLFQLQFSLLQFVFTVRICARRPS